MVRSTNFSPDHLASWTSQRASSIWSNMMTNNLWQRMLKNTLATTITVILASNPSVLAVYGKAAYLAPVTTVFGHPGRRFGMMAEALVLAVSGALLGMAWSTFGLYLSSLVYHNNSAAAYTIKGLFLSVALLVHGFLRSKTPRLFIMVLLLVIVSVVSTTSTAVEVSKLGVTQILYPILTAVGILLVVNTCVFPEFSSRFLGDTTIETLSLTTDTLRDAGRYFLQTIEPPTEQILSEEKVERKEKSSEVVLADENPKPNEHAAVHALFQPWKWYKYRHVTTEEAKANHTQPSPPAIVKLKNLTDAKAKLRSKLASCKSIQQECQWELAFAVLPPRDLKTISVTEMQKLVANAIALIGACESRYALLGDPNITPQVSKDVTSNEEKQSSDSEISRGATSANDASDSETNEDAEEKPKKSKRERKSLEMEIENLELVKPIKEIESGDSDLLEYLLKRIAQPLRELQKNIDRSTDVINSCLAYAYDVPKLPSGSKAPTGIQIEELDIRVDIMIRGIVEFDRCSASALESAVIIQDSQFDLMPRMETFLISSFILNQRSAANHILEMLKHSRRLVEKRLERKGRRRFYAPRINWRKWLSEGGEKDELALPSNARKEVRTGKQKDNSDEDITRTTASENDTLTNHRDEEATPNPECHNQPSTKIPKQTNFNANGNNSIGSSSSDDAKESRQTLLRVLWFRNKLADIIEYVYGSEDIAYAFKLTFAVFLVTWPAFIGRWNAWYSLNRGLWAALQLVLITEVAIGTSVMTFAIRAAGTTVGCLWGWGAFEASRGNRPALIVLLAIGIVPSTYVQLGSKYIKAGMVSIISMCVVALATVSEVVPGSATENFLKRYLAFLIGGTVALLVEVILYPVKARTRLVESLAAAIRMIEQMETCLAYGVETETNIDLSSPVVRQRFEEARSKAEGSLTAAETFLPFCANEPRLKGSFAGLALVYGEILYVLHQIVEKMDNMLQLRGEYGSSALEELHGDVYPYRRNVAGGILLILFAVHEALTTKLPLPQFLPSIRLAHLRMINRVRSLLVTHQEDTISNDMDISVAKRIARQKFVAFQAYSAGQIEVIEYLEELQELTKLLVGANEFKSGLLMRPTYREYIERINQNPPPLTLKHAIKAKAKGVDTEAAPKPTATQILQSNQNDEDEIRDILSETVTAPSGRARRRSTFKREGLERVRTKDREVEEKEKEMIKEMEENDLPRSLQRVRSRRVEEKNAELVRITSRREEEKAWVAGRETLEKKQ